MNSHHRETAEEAQAAPDIVVIGHIVIEEIYFPDHTIGPVLGSPVAYTSVAINRLGMRSGIVTKIGDDMPERLLQPLIETGVDRRGFVRDEHTTASRLIYTSASEKEIHYPNKASPIRFGDIPPSYHAARAFHVCPMDWDMGLGDISRLRQLGRLMSVDLGGYGGAHSQAHPSVQEQANPQALAHLVGHFDVVRASREDAAYLLGAAASDMESVPRRFVAWGAQVGIVSLGEAGAVVATRDTVQRLPPLSGRTVDTTGAGDTFSAGFLVAYLHTGDAVYSARFASAVALCVIEGTGGVAASRMPTLSDVEARLRQSDMPLP